MTDYRKYAYFLPNSFTAINMACGFASVLLSIKGEFYSASIVLFLGAIFDSVDGRIARLTGTQSAFGEQFDSLSDLISFGFAPAFLFYMKFLVPMERIGMVVSFLFLLCGALRLARFNANIDKNQSDYFQGLPIPSGATGVLGYVLMSLQFPEYFENEIISTVYLAIYSILMISSIPFPSFKKSPWIKQNKKQVLFLLFILFIAILVNESIMIPLIITAYVVGSLIYFVFNREKFSGIFDWKNEVDTND
jgi:CDP-diacylglycerol--serine O-phosphatidyltransferase